MLIKAMTYKIPEQPENSFRLAIKLEASEPRLDVALLFALQEQKVDDDMKKMTKTHLKKLFAEKKILIKGQSAKPKSSINKGLTYVDILLS